MGRPILRYDEACPAATVLFLDDAVCNLPASSSPPLMVQPNLNSASSLEPAQEMPSNPSSYSSLPDLVDTTNTHVSGLEIHLEHLWSLLDQQAQLSSFERWLSTQPTSLQQHPLVTAERARRQARTSRLDWELEQAEEGVTLELEWMRESGTESQPRPT